MLANMDPSAKVLIIILYSIIITIIALFLYFFKIRSLKKKNKKLQGEIEELKVRNEPLKKKDSYPSISQFPSNHNNKGEDINSTFHSPDKESANSEKSNSEETVEAKNEVKSQGQEGSIPNKVSTTNPPKAKVSILFAGVYNVEKDNFYSIKGTPSDDTIYVLKVLSTNEKKAELDLYPEAEDRIKDCRDLLEGCCECYGVGNTLSIEKGSATLGIDNIWRIDKKMTIKFS